MKLIGQTLTFTFLLCSYFSFAQSSNTKTSKAEQFFQPLKYRNIGPFRGGRSNTASGVVGDPLTYYMGTTGGGLWKTEDAGQHWNNISDGFFETGSVGAVAVSESNPNIVYCGMGEHAVRGVMTHHGDGVYKSIDAGKTWEKIGLEGTQHIARITIHPSNPNIVYVAAQGALYSPSEERGIYKSTDGGQTWSKILFVDKKTGCTELSMDKNHPHILYAAMWEHQRLPWKIISGGPGSGLYKSTDAGKTWKKIHKGLPGEKGKMAVSVCPSNSSKVYALIESDSDQEKGGLFVSNDAGGNWTRVSKDHRLTQRAWYYTEVFTDPQNENMVYVLSAPALRSIDGGKTWSRITGTHGDYHDLWINPDNPKNLCIANDGGAAISFNRGKTWSRQDNMPTVQIYRLNVDNEFPYNLYGGQQDNTSIKIASRALGRYRITERDWSYSAGGESAFLAFDPDNPRYVLGGSYLGTIEVLDTEANAGTDIMAAPIQYLSRAASDMKYRYNWNAPIIWSKHEPNTYYHAAQHLLRTRDMGKTWEEVSPDLTRNDRAKQVKGGGPYTVEAVGAENYGTISYVIESPQEKGVMWVGTDDGLVQLTKDGGATWQNVTPKGLKECLVNAIDVSPHDPATAYIATTRYKFNDHTPALYKTTNYGKTWTNITNGIPQGAFTRVVREDSQRKDLLFAGTETGIYVSWNGGNNWEAFQLNMPNTPITDLKLKHDDLIVATSGRSFWILDDLEAVRQYNPQATAMQLLQPADVILANGGSPLNGNSKSFKGTNPLSGVNPANGAVIYYHLPKTAEAVTLTMEISDVQGNIIRTFSSAKDTNYKSYAGGPPANPKLGTSEGLNRFVWDLRHSIMAGAPDAYIEGSYRGHKVIPGTYTIVLKNGTTQLNTTLKVLPNPLYPTDEATYQAYDELMKKMEGEFTQMHVMVNKMKDLQTKLNNVLTNMADDSEEVDLKKEGTALAEKMKAWDKDMVQRKSKAYDDVENFPNKFTAEYLFLINQTESDIPRINKPNLDRLAELTAEWDRLKKRGNELLDQTIPAYNQRLWEAGIGAIWEEKID
ncbi:MAG: glycosyl hydrolase [Bacteroidota bacterium]